VDFRLRLALSELGQLLVGVDESGRRDGFRLCATRSLCVAAGRIDDALPVRRRVAEVEGSSS